MTRLATIIFVLLFSVAALTGATIALVRITRRLRERRRARRAAGPRRALLTLAAAGTEADQADLERLTAMPPAAWRAVEPTAFELLGKVRGEARAALAEVFARRGLVARARADLRRGSAIRRARAASALGAIGDRPSVPELSRLLSDPHPEVRIAAIQALGRMGDPTAAAALVASLRAADPAPSQLVAHALVQLGPSAVPDLLAALDTGGPLVRATMLDALRLLGAAEAEQPVAEVLRGDPDLEVRRRAASTLGRIGSRSAVAPLLAAAGPDQPTVLRAAAARAMGELGDPNAVSPLTALLNSPEHRVGHQAAAALLRLGSAGATTLARAAAGTGPAAGYAKEVLAVDELARARARQVPRRLAGAGRGA